MKHYYIILIIVLTACAGTRPPAVRPMQTPDSFGSSSDTSTIGIPDWELYFGDPYLEALIDSAVLNNLDLKSAHQRVAAMQADLRFARGLLLPVGDVQAGASRVRIPEYTGDWAGNEGGSYADGTPLERTIPDLYLGFQSSWELDIRGRLRYQKKAAYERMLSSLSGMQLVVTNLVAELASRYYLLMALDQELRIVQATITKQEEALQVMRFSKEVGKANAMAVQQFEAQVLDTKALEFTTLTQINQIENEIHYLLGRFLGEVPRSSKDDLNVIDTLLTGVPAALLQNRADVRERWHELQATHLEVSAARAAFYPALVITGNVGLQAFKPEFLLGNPTSVGFSLLGGLTGPLLNRSAIRAEFESANARQLDALYEYQEAVINGYLETNSELVNLHNLYQVYLLSVRENEVLQESVRTAYELFRTGKATYMEVLIAQQNALDAELDLVRVKRDIHLGQVNLYRVLGGGWK